MAMWTLRLVGFALLGMMAVTAAWAHDGHQHKLMGTVSYVDQARLEVTTKEGKVASVELTTETKVFKGEKPATTKDIEKGARVVVETDGAAEQPKALVVRLSPSKK
jgi:Cu/Ag efflux protein CusF